MLSDQRRQQLDGIVQDMVKNKEPDNNIQFVVNDFKKKYEGETLKPIEAPKEKGLLRSVGDFFTSSEQALGKSLGDAAAYVTGTGKKIDKVNQDLLETANKTMELARNEKNPERKKVLEEQAKFAAQQSGSNYSNVIPSVKKTTGQILGEGLGVATDVLSAGKYGKAALGGKVLPRVAQTAVEGAIQGYGLDVSQKLQKGQASNSFTPGVGTTVGAISPFASSLVGSLSKKVAGKLSGTGTEVIQRAIENPNAVGEAIQKYAKSPETQQELVTKAEEALHVFTNQRNKEYSQALNSLVIKNPVPKNLVRDSFLESAQKFGGSLNEKGEIVFGDSALTKADKTNLTDAWDSIRNWKDITPKGLDTLRQNIQNHMKDFKVAGNPRANVVLGAVNNTLKSALKESMPGYGEMLSSYGSKAEAATEFAKEFQIAGNAKDSTKLKNLMKIFKKDPTAMKSLEEIMGKKGATNFLNEVSGAILSNWTSPGRLQNIIQGGGQVVAAGGSLLAGHPIGAVLAGTAFAGSSPRVVGKTATVLSKGIKKGVGTATRRLLTKISAKE